MMSKTVKIRVDLFIAKVVLGARFGLMLTERRFAAFGEESKEG
jgi:hypothetical protein